MDSPSDLPSKSIYNIEHLETTEASFSGLVTAKMHGRKKEKEVRGREKDKKINALCFYCLPESLSLPCIKKCFTTFWRSKHLTNYSVSPKVKLSFLHHTLRWHLGQFSLKNKIQSDSLLDAMLIGVV